MPQLERVLEPVRVAAVARTQAHDVFLCQAWPDRQADAKDVYDLFVGNDVSMWFSEGTDWSHHWPRNQEEDRYGNSTFPLNY